MFPSNPPAGVEGPIWRAINSSKGASPRIADLMGYSYLPGEPRHFATQISCTTGTVFLSGIPVPVGEEIAAVAYSVNTAVATPTAAQNIIGLLDTLGNLLWVSADQSTNFGVTGKHQLLLSSGTFQAGVKKSGTNLIVPDNGGIGLLYVGVLSVATTGVKMWGSGASGSSDGPMAELVLAATGGTSKTAFDNPTTITAAAHNQIWAALTTPGKLGLAA